MSVADSSRRLARERLENRLANEPMNPAGSMAMAGNYGLAGLSQNQANQIKQAQQTINQFNDQFKGNTSEPVTFKDIGQQFGEMGSKYRRPVDKDRYANKANLFNQGIAGGGKIFVGPDGIPRLSFNNQVVRDPKTGAQMMSMMLPYMTAQAPTLGQLGGDIKRAFTGYDSLKYVDDDFQGPFPLSKSPNFTSRDLPYMQYTPGMFEGVNPLSFVPFAGTAMKVAEGVQGLYDYFTKDPVVTYGGSSDMTVTEEPIRTAPQFPYNFETVIKRRPLTNEILPTNLNQEDFNNTYKFLDQRSRLDNLPFKAKPNVSDQTDFETALANARVDNLGLPSLTDLYNFGKNPELKTKVGNFRFDNVLTGNPQLGYGNTFMFNDLPVDLNATIGQGGLNFGASMNFKKGGSVDKYAGLGYKLK
jgi:hypothetical protein